MTIRFSFDTNVLIYAIDTGAGHKRLLARELLNGARLNSVGFIPEQSIVEFLHVVTRKMGVPLAQSVAFIRDLLEIFDLLLAREDIIRRTLELLSSHRLSVWDARMLALCGSHSCAVLFSEDMQDGATYDGVRVVNPFSDANRAILNEIVNS